MAKKAPCLNNDVRFVLQTLQCRLSIQRLHSPKVNACSVCENSALLILQIEDIFILGLILQKVNKEIKADLLMFGHL